MGTLFYWMGFFWFAILCLGALRTFVGLWLQSRRYRIQREKWERAVADRLEIIKARECE